MARSSAATMARKRILFLTPQVPYPPEQGAAIRNYNLVTQVARRHDVGLLSFRQAGQADDAASGPLAKVCDSLATVAAPVRSVPQRLRAMLTSSAPDMAQRLFSDAFAELLLDTLSAQAYDIVQVEGIEMAPYALLVQEWLGAKAPAIVYDAHNAEYLLQRRAFSTDLGRPRRWAAAGYSFVQWRRLVRYERMICQRSDAVVCVSEADGEALARLRIRATPQVVPNGVDTARYHRGLADALPLEHPALVFTGKMDFRPNVDAMLWFWGQVWPLIRRAVPQARLYVVGKSPHASLAPLRDDPQVAVTGYVEDILPYFGGADIYVVPLRVGGGTRLKVLEAMASGLPMVTTSLGAEGIALSHGENALVADSVEAFAEAVVTLVQSPERRAALGAAARAFAVAHYDWQNIVPQLFPTYEGR